MPWLRLMLAWSANPMLFQALVVDAWLRELTHQRRQLREWPRARVLRDEEVARLLAD